MCRSSFALNVALNFDLVGAAQVLCSSGGALESATTMSPSAVVVGVDSVARETVDGTAVGVPSVVATIGA